MSMKSNIEHHELDESDFCSHESCEEDVEPTILDIDDDILSIEYESFSCGFDVTLGLYLDLCAEYESFLFNPIHTDLPFESCKS